MSSKPPPIPPEQRSRKGPGPITERSESEEVRQQEKNFGEQGRQGNIKQNTTNKGYQQDR
jgi:hypothetical protein